MAPGFDAPSIAAAPDPASEVGERAGEAVRSRFSKLGKKAQSKEALPEEAVAPLAPAKKGAMDGSQLADGIAAGVQGLQSDNGLLVVTCEITPNAAREDSFRRVLTRNQISLDDAQSPAARADPAHDAGPRKSRNRSEAGQGRNRPRGRLRRGDAGAARSDLARYDIPIEGVPLGHVAPPRPAACKIAGGSSTVAVAAA